MSSHRARELAEAVAPEGRARPVILTWLLLAGISGSLLLRATLAPPPGTVFVGTNYFVGDFYNYLSYVQQAGDGALVFRNKLAPPTLPPVLVNVEWLLVGWLAKALGGSPLLAYHLLGFVALLALVWLVDRWLVRGGLPPPRRLAGLLLVFTGGGLGGVLFAAGWLPGERALDLRAGLFPFLEVVANPHFVFGTALLTAALGAFAAGHPGRGVLLGNILALARPYDAALLVGVVGLATLLRWPVREWPRRLLPAAALVPVLAYDAWVFLFSPGYRIFSSEAYGTFGRLVPELLIAVGPAALVALTAMRLGDDDGPRRHRVYLALWAALAVTIAVLRPVSFSLQFLVGIGVPLLALGAIGLGRRRRGVLEAAVVVLAGTSMVVVWLLMHPLPGRYAPLDRWRLAAELRPVCRPGEVALSPPDIGLYVGAFTACWPYVSHAVSPEHAVRDAATRRFYAASPADRRLFLDETCVSHVVVPGGWPNGGLPPEAPFRRRLLVEGPGDGLAVYSREASTPCRPAPDSP